MGDTNHALFASVAYAVSGDDRADDKQAIANLGWLQLLAPMPKCEMWARKDTIVIAFRGTVPTDLEDIASDVALVRGEEWLNIRFIVSSAMVGAVCRKANEHHMKVILCGHSLGGSLAIYCGSRHPVHEVHAYNPFVSLSMLTYNVTPFRKLKHVTLYLVNEDPINVTANALIGVKAKVRKSMVSNNPHSLRDNWVIV